jgi:hypothetical protein
MCIDRSFWAALVVMYRNLWSTSVATANVDARCVDIVAVSVTLLWNVRLATFRSVYRPNVSRTVSISIPKMAHLLTNIIF